MSSDKSKSDSIIATGSYKSSDGNARGNQSGNRGGAKETIDNIYDYDDEEIDEIDEIGDKDPADVDNSASHENFIESEKVMSVESPEYENFNIENAMVAAEVRLKKKHEASSAVDRHPSKKNKFSIRKVIFGIIGAIAVLVIIGVSFKFGQNSMEINEPEKSIEEKTSAYDFNDQDEYAESTGAETTDAEIIEVNTIEDDGTFDDSTLDNLSFRTGASENESPEEEETPEEISSIMETEILLRSTTVFPLGMESFLIEFTEPVDTDYDTPLFWMIPFSGGIFQNLMTACSKKVLASNQRSPTEDTMKIVYVRQNPYVNVNLFTDEGIESAARQGLAGSGLADVFVSNQVSFPTNELFDNNHRGRLFAALRHPVKRVISIYHFISPRIDDPVCSSLEGCLSSRYIDKNWVTRFLINKRNGPLVQEDLQLAKEILRTRCLIGLYEEIELSMNLFEQYFGWTMEGHNAKHSYDNCKSGVIETELTRKREVYASVGNIETNSLVYEKIAQLNYFDMELYSYAHDLFQEQQLWVTANRPSP